MLVDAERCPAAAAPPPPPGTAVAGGSFANLELGGWRWELLAGPAQPTSPPAAEKHVAGTWARLKAVHGLLAPSVGAQMLAAAKKKGAAALAGKAASSRNVSLEALYFVEMRKKEKEKAAD
jgi:hypothetical protein